MRDSLPCLMALTKRDVISSKVPMAVLAMDLPALLLPLPRLKLKVTYSVEFSSLGSLFSASKSFVSIVVSSSLRSLFSTSKSFVSISVSSSRMIMSSSSF